MEQSNEMQDYFNKIEAEIKNTYEVAEKARKKGFEPERTVDVRLAKNMAERVEGLISVVAPQLVNSGMTKRIIALEKKYSAMDWRVALLIAEEVAKEKFCKFKNKKEAIEVGIRVGFAYHTGGIVAAPLEGFIELKIKKTKDNKEYLVSSYAGPIRGAGGTGAAFSLLIVDYLRAKMGFSKYDPTEEEISRYITEVDDYHERVTNLQYHPSEKEIRFLAKNLPVEIDGDPTEKIEVSKNKDLPRIETNRIRGGVCLVLAEGLAQKAPKLWKRLSVWGKDFGLEWVFLEEFLKLQKQAKAGQTEIKKEKITPNFTYISDLVAGRPVLSFPMRTGGFRLRYGRSRVSGFSASCINPCTMHLLKNYIAIGTQLKIERPGKATTITTNDLIEGPIIKLADGSVVFVNTIEEAKQYAPLIKEILFLGDILINYGDFSENGHLLVPCGYNEEWWVKELEKATVDLFGSIDPDKLSDTLHLDSEKIEKFLKEPLKIKPDAETSLIFSKKLGIPLHPKFTYHWRQITTKDILLILEWLKGANIVYEDLKLKKIIFPYKEKEKILFEKIGFPHYVINKEFVVVEKDHSFALLSTLNFALENYDKIKAIIEENDDILSTLTKLAGFPIRDKSGTFLGARMGRPEKAKMRELRGSPHVLFPVGEEGGRLRSFLSALEQGKVTADFPLFFCKKCNKETIYQICGVCKEPATKQYHSNELGIIEKPEPKQGVVKSYKNRSIDIKRYFDAALKLSGLNVSPDLVKGVRGTSNKDHIPENLVKGLLRSKHKIHVNKDGTIRYDMTELPLTHFKPREINVPIKKLKELGYTKDLKGMQLENKNQVLELKPQDLVLPSAVGALDEPSDAVLFRVSKFVDDLLTNLYEQNKFYNLKTKEDLVGHLVLGVAPHISAGTVGRIIGFSNTQAMFAHPLFHAAIRRDCDGDEMSVTLLLDGLLNFSRQYLPDSRGSRTMDAPLVLTSKIVPSEVDDQVHGLDVVWQYPLEFYQTAMEYKMPGEIKIEQIKSRLNTEKQYEKIGFTHNTTDFNMGITCSAYKARPSMEEKLQGQMELAELIKAVNQHDVAKLVIEKHFLKDIKGNLRKFSQQQFRCVACNEKFRRPPLSGKCTKCSGRIIFTISEGSVVKYLGPSFNLANKYNVPVHLKQTLELLKRRIESVFGKDKEKQAALEAWV